MDQRSGPAEIRDHRLTAAVLSLYFMLLVSAGVMPALQNISELFPDVAYANITYIGTLPSLFLIPFNLISGALAGKKIAYRKLAVAGVALYTAAGIIPAWIHSFTGILLCRALMGCALGLIYPLGNALILRLYPENVQHVIIGYGTIAMNVGIMVVQTLVGILMTVKTEYIWFAYLVCIIPLLFIILWLREPEHDIRPGTQESDRRQLPPALFLNSLMILIFPICYASYTSGMASVTMGEGFGTAAQITLASNLNTIAGIITGFLLGQLLKHCGRATTYLGFLLSGISLILCGTGETMTAYYIGSILMGFGMNIAYASLMIEANTILPPGRAALGSAIMLASYNIGMVLSSSCFGLIAGISHNSSMRLPMFAGAAGCIVLLLLHLLFQRYIDAAGSMR